MRVTGGELGGRRLRGPRRGDDVRPTTDRVREAVFSILGEVDGARVLDLFCGTGALGIEALSRGAAAATLVDSDPAVARRNVDALGISERADVVRSDAVRFLGRAPESAFDLVLCDPPYGLVQRLGSQLDPLIQRALAADGRVMIETALDSPFELALPLLREKRYGDTLVRIHGSDAREDER